MKIDWTHLGFIFVHEVIQALVIHQGMWTEDKSERNRIYNAAIYTEELSNIANCAFVCLTRSNCQRFSFSSTARMCRGYSSTALTDKTIQYNTSFWTKSCRLEGRGYTYDVVFNTCLKFYQTNQTREGAANACANDGAYLLIPDTVQKLNVLAAQYKGILSDDRWWWFGGYDYGSGFSYDFRWDDGRTINGYLWFSGEPYGVDERCVAYLGLSMGGLFSRQCDNKAFFVCQDAV